MSRAESRRFQLLIFDWDGTLMDSVATIVACMNQSAADLGMEPLADEEIRKTIGLGLVDTMKALGFSDDRESWQPIVERYSANWRATYRHHSELFAGAAQTIEELHQTDYLLAVATGKSRRGLRDDFKKTGIGDQFHASRTADETRSKPNPQMILELLDELGVRPDEALMIGDTTYDLEMARHGGIHSLGVTTGSHSREELESQSPLTCLAGVTELPAWLAATGRS